MKRLPLLALLLPLAFAPAPASADPICAYVVASTSAGEIPIFTSCLPWSGTTRCATVTEGVPRAYVIATVCTPIR